MGGHDGRSANRDRFRGNRFDERFDGNGELNHTGRFAVVVRNQGDLGSRRHRYSLHENRIWAV